MAGIKPVESVFVQGLTPDQTITMVRELRAHGLVQGIDFDFAVRQSSWDLDNGQILGGAEFYFYQAKWRTFFALKYAN